jgi:hypothetical protein
MATAWSSSGAQAGAAFQLASMYQRHVRVGMS